VLGTDILASGATDVPFCMTYLMSENDRLAYLVAAAGFPAGSPACPAIVPLSNTARRKSRGPSAPRCAPGGSNSRRPREPDWRHDSGGHGRSRHAAPSCCVGRRLGWQARRLPGVGYQSTAQVRRAVRNVRHPGCRRHGGGHRQRHGHDRERSALRTRLDKIASIAPVAIFEFRISPDGKFTMPYSTPAIAHIYGRTPEELAAMSRWPYH